MALVMPLLGTLSVPLVVIGPPVNPAPLPTLVTVPVLIAAQFQLVPLNSST